MGREKKHQASTFSAWLPRSASLQAPLPTPTLLSSAGGMGMGSYSS